MSDILKSPFPYFGGKSRIASLVWERFGKVENYVEPFFGSGAVLLGCPHLGHTETVNDACGLLANFWRALQHAPDEVASYADWPVNECDLHARHRWLVDRRPMVEELMEDPEWYDAKAAGWWVWGISQWIGTGWCPRAGAAPRQAPRLGDQGQGVNRKLSAQAPRLSAAGQGIHRKMPSVSSAGMDAHARAALHQKMPEVGSSRGVHRDLSRKMPFIASPSPDRKQYGLGIHGKRLSQQMPELDHARGVTARMDEPSALYSYFRALSTRLRRVRVICGDFARILGPSVTWRHGLTAVFLDPPYADAEHAVSYSGGGNVWERATAWCEENGDNPLLRIALCGYEGTWEASAGWTAIKWRTSGGYGSQGNARGRENATRETIWFNKSCLNPSEQAKDALNRPIVVSDSDWSGTLFEEADDAA